MPSLIAFVAALALPLGLPLVAAPSELQEGSPLQSAGLQAGPGQTRPQAASHIKVFSECDASSPVVALLPRDAAIDVHYSIAGATTCYFVTLSAQGKTAVQGFVVDPDLDAVASFDASRLENARIAFKAPVPVPVMAPAASAIAAEPTKTAIAEKAPEKKPVVVPKPRKDVSM
jgi:hypothetical protein